MDWTAEQRATLRAGREAGKSYTVIAREMGINKNQAVGAGQRMKLPRGDVRHIRLRVEANNPAWSTWDEETTARFIREWTTNDRTNRLAIARKFGIGEQAAIYRAEFLGIKRAVHKSNKTGMTAGALPPLPKLRLVPPAPKPVIVAPLSRDGVPLVFAPRPPGTCCWPMWSNQDPPTHRYCDAPAAGTYCEAHRDVAYVGRVRRGTEFVFSGLLG